MLTLQEILDAQSHQRAIGAKDGRCFGSYFSEAYRDSLSSQTSVIPEPNEEEAICYMEEYTDPETGEERLKYVSTEEIKNIENK